MFSRNFTVSMISVSGRGGLADSKGDLWYSAALILVFQNSG